MPAGRNRWVLRRSRLYPLRAPEYFPPRRYRLGQTESYRRAPRDNRSAGDGTQPGIGGADKLLAYLVRVIIRFAIQVREALSQRIPVEHEI